MLTTSINKPVLLRFSHVKYRSLQTFLRINATWKVRVLDCDQIWVESVKDLLEVEVRSILPVQDVAKIARRAECVVAHLAFSSPSHSLPELKSMVRCMSLSNSSSSLSLSLLSYLLLDSVCVADLQVKLQFPCWDSIFLHFWNLGFNFSNLFLLILVLCLVNFVLNFISVNFSILI
ncbi:uncharacterized protein LOC125479754 isoform X3 [Pyrus x bretschneideri]|uniref:uncharacterized protein LOC125479754 isoform X3 n=1 Tax=Pyrus x bretschneideri TaxID=225117 RepID=UPI00202E0432|nr:uncharacterized protein LOC125479754 isoform X3 [Pyrus x bretschneideri]XP_048445551.1 uncharacterized protein LOC125479754 isoform X3 [Pyrus x bretschneideri]XP_048445552.1 uncharacterized protein LOC125479754 isoform X3 [Pyrus x bretschneideri]